MPDKHDCECVKKLREELALAKQRILELERQLVDANRENVVLRVDGGAAVTIILEPRDGEYLARLVSSAHPDEQAARALKAIRHALTVEARRMLEVAAPAPQPIAQSEYPLTLAAIRRFDPAVDEMFVLGLVQASLQYCMSHPGFPQQKVSRISDRTIAHACTFSFETGPRGHRAGLLRNRVPPILVSWATD